MSAADTVRDARSRLGQDSTRSDRWPRRTRWDGTGRTRRVRRRTASAEHRRRTVAAEAAPEHRDRRDPVDRGRREAEPGVEAVGLPQRRIDPDRRHGRHASRRRSRRRRRSARARRPGAGWVATRRDARCRPAGSPTAGPGRLIRMIAMPAGASSEQASTTRQPGSIEQLEQPAADIDRGDRVHRPLGPATGLPQLVPQREQSREVLLRGGPSQHQRSCHPDPLVLVTVSTCVRSEYAP